MVSIRRKRSICSTVCQLILFLSLLPLHDAQRNRRRDFHENNNDFDSRNHDHDDEDNRTLELDEVRFNKFFFSSSTITKPRGFKPLKSKDYPITGLTNVTLRLSDAVSVTTMDDFEVIYDVQRLIRNIGGLPSYPDPDRNAPYWNLREVIQVQKVRRRNPNDNTLFPKPERWKNADLNEIAELVHDEMPGSLQADLLFDILTEQHGRVEVDLDIIPYRTNTAFLRKHFLVAMLNTWSMSVVGPHNFAAKWYAGRARPEEVVWLIIRGKVRGAPSDIERDIRQMNIRSASDFTAYDEGSPNHPSWPAMHAATASTSFWLSIVMNLNDEQLCQARLTDYGISYARTIAGVHYTDDNIAGLNMAQEVLARALPKFLKDKYNANPFLVARKIREKRFDWRTFDPENPCPRRF